MHIKLYIITEKQPSEQLQYLKKKNRLMPEYISRNHHKFHISSFFYKLIIGSISKSTTKIRYKEKSSFNTIKGVATISPGSFKSIYHCKEIESQTCSSGKPIFMLQVKTKNLVWKIWKFVWRNKQRKIKQTTNKHPGKTTI